MYLYYFIPIHIVSVFLLLNSSSEIWSDKVKFVYYKAHGVTERTEVMQRYGGADGTKSDGGIAYRFLITLLG